jgi:hypothetical protein
MPQCKQCADGCGEANHPNHDESIGRGRHGPECCREDEKNDQTCQLETASGAWVDVGLAATDCAVPACLKAERHERNPKKMPGVEGAELYGAAGTCTRETVVIAEGDAFRTEMIDAVDEEQGSSRVKRWAIIARKEGVFPNREEILASRVS